MKLWRRCNNGRRFHGRREVILHVFILINRRLIVVRLGEPCFAKCFDLSEEDRELGEATGRGRDIGRGLEVSIFAQSSLVAVQWI